MHRQIVERGCFGSPPRARLLGGACDRFVDGVPVAGAGEIEGVIDQNRLSDSDATEALRGSAVR